jgi:hypothetical protein
MTQKLNTDNGLQGRWTRTTGYNSTYPKGGGSCFKDSFVVNQSLVLRINIVVKIATFAKPDTVMGKFKPSYNGECRKSIKE